MPQEKNILCLKPCCTISHVVALEKIFKEPISEKSKKIILE